MYTGNQGYRSCWAIEYKDAIIYATDTQREPNYIKKIDQKERSSVENLHSLNGSSIYHCFPDEESVIFSTTIEPDYCEGNYFKSLVTRKRGPGILSDRASIHQLNLRTGEMSEIYSSFKDFLPFGLGQFGTFSFPSIEGACNYVIAYGMALRGVDGTMLKIRL